MSARVGSCGCLFSANAITCFQFDRGCQGLGILETVIEDGNVAQRARPTRRGGINTCPDVMA